MNSVKDLFLLILFALDASSIELAEPNSKILQIRIPEGNTLEAPQMSNQSESWKGYNKSQDSRDKRALGIILQAFGYSPTLSLGSLPNPNVTTNSSDQTYVGLIGRIPTMPSAQATPAPPTPPITYPPGSTIPLTVPTLPQLTYPPNLIPRPTPRPNQRQTLRFTGVVNLGNNSNLTGHLQQYEQLFHGGQSSPVMTTTPAYVPAPPRLPFFSYHHSGVDATKEPLLTPLLVSIPLPIAPELLPSREPYKTDREMEYRKKENVENYQVQKQELSSPAEVSRGVMKSYQKNPYWEKLYEDRIAELERQTEKLAQKLDEDDKRRAYEKSMSGESNEGQYRVEDSEENSKEKNGDGSDENEMSSYYDGDSSEECEEGSKEAERDSEIKPSGENIYDLPLNYHRERMEPSESLKNSYGEQLEHRGVLDGRVGDYYSMFRGHSGENKRGRPYNHDGKESGDRSKRPFSQNNGFPREKSKYEEYNLYDESGENENTGSSKVTHIHQNPLNRSMYIVHSTVGTLNERDPIGYSKPDYISKTSQKLALSNYMPQTRDSFMKQEYRKPPTKAPKKEIETLKITASKPSVSTLPYFDFIKFSPYTIPVQYVYEPASYEKLRQIAENYKPQIKHRLKDDDKVESFEEAEQKEMSPTSDEEYFSQRPLPTVHGHINEEESKDLRVAPLPFDDFHRPNRQEERIVTHVPAVAQTYRPYEDSSRETTTKNVGLKGYLLVHPAEEFNTEDGKSEEEINNDTSMVSEEKIQQQNTVSHLAKTNHDPRVMKNYEDLVKSYEYGEMISDPYDEKYFSPTYGEYDKDHSGEYEYRDDESKESYMYAMPKITRKVDEGIDSDSRIDDSDMERLMENAKTNITNKRTMVTTYEIRSSNINSNPATNDSSKDQYRKFNYKMTEFIPLESKEESTTTSPSIFGTKKTFQSIDSDELNLKTEDSDRGASTGSIKEMLDDGFSVDYDFLEPKKEIYKIRTLTIKSTSPDFKNNKSRDKHSGSKVTSFMVSDDKEINSNETILGNLQY